MTTATNLQRFKGKVAVVTGGASGIGRAVALGYAREGASVAIGDINEKQGRAVALAIEKAGGKALFAKTDVTKGAEVQNLVARAVKAYGSLTTLYAAAGVYSEKDAKVADIDVAVFDALLDVNLKGMFYAAKYALPHLVETQGSLVLTASRAGAQGGEATGFAVSTGAVINLMRGITYQYGPKNVRASVIIPSAIDTPLFSDIRTIRHLSREATGKMNLIGRTGTPEEAANLVLFLTSDDASYATGGVYTVDGGW